MNTIVKQHWSRSHPGTLPPPRLGSTMAYDAQHKVVVLFGGGGLDDTWIWDGSSWTLQHPHVSPPARTLACMAYHTASQRVVLFGGVDVMGTPLGDTWTWDGSSWMLQHPHTIPAPRSGSGLTHDSARQRLVLFGGMAEGGRVGTLLHDTWTWNGADWAEHAVSPFPPSRVGANLSYDHARQRSVLFGGTAGHTTYNDTWTWNGSAWTRLQSSSRPPARAWACMDDDLAIQRVVLVGGSSANPTTHSPELSDTWLWDGSSWTQTIRNAAPVGGYQSIAYDEARHRLVIYTATGNKPALGNKTHGPGLVSNTRPHLESEIWLWGA